MLGLTGKNSDCQGFTVTSDRDKTECKYWQTWLRRDSGHEDVQNSVPLPKEKLALTPALRATCCGSHAATPIGVARDKT
jgi:hypothetical protein